MYRALFELLRKPFSYLEARRRETIIEVMEARPRANSERIKWNCPTVALGVDDWIYVQSLGQTSEYLK